MITSASNGQVKELQKLQKSSKFRKAKGRFVIEGWRMLDDVPAEMVDRIYVSEDHISDIPDRFQCPVETVSAPVLKAMTNEVQPQGVLALVKMTSMDKTITSVDKPLIIALDCVQDPGNLGTVIRTAEAAGADQILLSKGTVDLYNPKVVKATMGAICRMNILVDVDLTEMASLMKGMGVRLFAAHLKGKAQHFEEDYRAGTCFLMGNEGNGLSDEVAALADTYIKIPMTQDAESLNVAMATGILVYEAVRQRSDKGQASSDWD